MSELRFTPDQRLLNSPEFNAVFNGNQFKVSSAEFLVLAMTNQKDSSRLGLVIGKKAVPLAVSRNRIKRVIRETFRTNLAHRVNLDLVVIARKPANLIDKKAIADVMNRLWNKLESRVKESNAC